MYHSRLLLAACAYISTEIPINDNFECHSSNEKCASLVFMGCKKLEEMLIPTSGCFVEACARVWPFSLLGSDVYT